MSLLLRQMRRQWRSNIWLVIELVIITVATWYITDLLAQCITPVAEPTGFDTEHVYSITCATASEEADVESELSTADELRELLTRLGRYPGVEAVSLASWGVQPFDESMMTTHTFDVDADSIGYSDENHRGPALRWGKVNDGFLRVFRVTGARGETPEALATLFTRGTVLLSDNFTAGVDTTRLSTPPDPYTLTGHRFTTPNENGLAHLRGIIKQVKRQRTERLSRTSLALLRLDETDDADLDEWNLKISIRVRPEADHGFAEGFKGALKTQFCVGTTYFSDIRPFERLRSERENNSINTIIRFVLFGLFLLVNIFLGLLGTFWYRTRTRVSEIALRKSFGATPGMVFRSLIAEGLILAGIGMAIAAILIAALIYCDVRLEATAIPLTVPYMVMIAIITIAAIMAVTVLGIWIPARKAMKIDPVTALHDE